MDVNIKQYCIRSLVDSGSSICCVKQSLLHKIFPTPKPLQKSEFPVVKGVSGKLIPVKGTIMLDLNIGNAKFSQKFHVFDNIHHDLIIGIDFLKKNKCSLDFSTSTLRSDSGIPIVNFVSSLMTGLARLKKTVILQPMSETLVPVKISKVPSNTAVLLEPVQSLLNNQITCARALLKSVNRSSACRVLNPLPVSVTLRSNSVVGKLTPIDESSVCALGKEQVCSMTNETDIKACVNSAAACTSDHENVLTKLGISLDNSVLSNEQLVTLKQFIHENKDMFATDTSQLGCTKLHSHRIETGNAPPQRQNAYRYPPLVKAEIDKQIDDYLKNDFIEPSNAMWAAPVVMCKKKDNTYRFAIDYRKLNAVTVPINFPLPRFEDVVDSVAENQSKIFTVLDLKAGFHQIPLDPETKHKSTFICHSGTYNFKRLPYGLRNTPVAFQCLMSSVLRGSNFKFTLVYVDDILIHSPNWSSHLVHLKMVFDRLRQADLKIQPKKCRFAAPRVEYLGHLFSEKGIEVNPDKVKVVKSFPVPKNQKNV